MSGRRVGFGFEAWIFDVKGVLSCISISSQKKIQIRCASVIFIMASTEIFDVDKCRQTGVNGYSTCTNACEGRHKYS